MRIGLLQCELEHRHQAPHVAMALYATDLLADGHDVRCALVHPTSLIAAAEELGDADLLLLDSIFPFALIEALKAVTAAPIVVGGHNALQHALRGPADVAIVGPGRRAVGALAEGTSRHEIPGTWWRDEDGTVRAGPAAGEAVLGDLEPFTPHVDWAYFGPPRAPGSNLRVPSVVADAGCPWNRSVLSDGGPYAGVAPRLPDVPLGDRARRLLEGRFVEREGGCTFCAFRYTTHARGGDPDRLAAQAEAWRERGARGLSLQSEHPLPAILPLLDRAPWIEELHVRTIPWLVLRHADAWAETIREATSRGVQLVLGQVGFEAFDDGTLAAYHKGLTAAENRAAARLLGEWDAAFDGFVGTAGHGLVPLQPWTTVEGLRETLAACRADAPWLLPQLTPGSRIELYEEYAPLFWKADDEGLVRPDRKGFGWTWEFADARTGEVVAAWGALAASAPGVAAADLLEEVLDVMEGHADPADRRTAYLQMRDRLGRSIFVEPPGEG